MIMHITRTYEKYFHIFKIGTNKFKMIFEFFFLIHRLSYIVIQLFLKILKNLRHQIRKYILDKVKDHYDQNQNQNQIHDFHFYVIPYFHKYNQDAYLENNFVLHYMKNNRYHQKQMIKTNTKTTNTKTTNIEDDFFFMNVSNIW